MLKFFLLSIFFFSFIRFKLEMFFKGIVFRITQIIDVLANEFNNANIMRKLIDLSHFIKLVQPKFFRKLIDVNHLIKFIQLNFSLRGANLVL